MKCSKWYFLVCGSRDPDHPPHPLMCKTSKEPNNLRLVTKTKSVLWRIYFWMMEKDFGNRPVYIFMFRPKPYIWYIYIHSYVYMYILFYTCIYMYALTEAPFFCSGWQASPSNLTTPFPQNRLFKQLFLGVWKSRRRPPPHQHPCPRFWTGQVTSNLQRRQDLLLWRTMFLKIGEILQKSTCLYFHVSTKAIRMIHILS